MSLGCADSAVMLVLRSGQVGVSGLCRQSCHVGVEVWPGGCLWAVQSGQSSQVSDDSGFRPVLMEDDSGFRPVPMGQDGLNRSTGTSLLLHHSLLLFPMCTGLSYFLVFPQCTDLTYCVSTLY